MAKIGLSVGVAACAGLSVVLVLLSQDGGESYIGVIGAYGQAQQSLGPAMLVFGLAMAGFAGITTWLFSLYASFRIAGPMYRISRDLEIQIERGPVALTSIRKTDKLQREWKEFDAGVAALRAHCAELKQALSEAETALHAGGAHAAAFGAAIARLKETEQHVWL